GMALGLARCRWAASSSSRGKNSQAWWRAMRRTSPCRARAWSAVKARAVMLMSGSRSSWWGLVWGALCLGTPPPTPPLSRARAHVLDALGRAAGPLVRAGDEVHHRAEERDEHDRGDPEGL